MFKIQQLVHTIDPSQPLSQDASIKAMIVRQNNWSNEQRRRQKYARPPQTYLDRDALKKLKGNKTITSIISHKHEKMKQLNEGNARIINFILIRVSMGRVGSGLYDTRPGPIPELQTSHLLIATQKSGLTRILIRFLSFSYR